ncbi:MAG: hypothetical protein ABSD29_22780 [Verrucomicrobiota bacterium]|jgi:hypothetical protein
MPGKNSRVWFNQRMGTRFQFLHVGLAVCCLALGARCQGLLIDQENEPSTTFLAYFNLSFPGATPIGQEFVPSLGSLDFVDLMTYGGGDSGATGTFEVRIHEGSSTAPVMAASTPTERTDGSEALTHFVFPSPVPLTPGDLYVMEFVEDAGSSGWGLGADPLAGYPAGQMIYGGAERNDYDLWFGEGIVVPEPSMMTFYLLGMAALICGCRRHKIVGLTISPS